MGNYKPLHSSVDAKLEAICKSLAEGRRIEASKKKRPRLSTGDGLEVGQGQEQSGVVMVDDPVSDGSDWSSQSSDLTFPEFTDQESTWVGSDFLLEKYPSYQIDWSSI